MCLLGERGLVLGIHRYVITKLLDVPSFKNISVYYRLCTCGFMLSSFCSSVVLVVLGDLMIIVVALSRVLATYFSAVPQRCRPEHNTVI